MTALAAATVLVHLNSCSDDDDAYNLPASDSRISIQPSVSDVWHSGSRADNACEVGGDGVIQRGYRVESHVPGDTLYIFEAVSDRIVSERPQAPQSRGQWVDSEGLRQRRIGVYSLFLRRPADGFYMANVPYHFSGGEHWTSVNDPYFWPVGSCEENDLQFFACCPDDAIQGSPRFSEANDSIKLRYSVPDGINDQPDLLISDMTDIDYTASDALNNHVKLNFRHALSAVRIKFGKESFYPGKITNVCLRKIVRDGEYDVLSKEWDTSRSEIHDYSYKCDIPVNEIGTDERDTFSASSGDLIGSSGIQEVVSLMMISRC